MNSLKTSFAGLELKNPIIISSCGRTGVAQNNKALEDAGVAAIVLKSMFEENIVLQTESMTSESAHSEEADYLQGYLRQQMLQEYIDLIKESKRLCTIPIIASINCYGNGEWAAFAELIEKAGADALELNVMSIRTSVEYNDGDFENQHIDILRSVKSRIKIPVIVKLGSNLSNPVSLINRLHAYGAAGVVLFNRFYQPDIDIDKMEYTSGHVFSSEADLAPSLRWTGIASAAVKQLDYAVSGGVHGGNDIVKSILVGASAVEVCSAIYLKGEAWIKPALECVRTWQEQHGYSSPADYRGKMNARDTEHAVKLDRTQFLKYFEVHK